MTSEQISSPEVKSFLNQKKN